MEAQAQSKAKLAEPKDGRTGKTSGGEGGGIYRSHVARLRKA